MSRQRLNVQAPVHRLIAERWSPRAFDASRPVATAELASCLEAARWAPSCYGDEPWRFIVTDRFEDKRSWQAMHALLAPANRSWAQHAPILIAVCAATAFRNGQPNRWGAYDTGQAAMALCLQATALGLQTHQMGGFDVEGLRARFAVPEDFMPMSIVALGHGGSPATLESQLREREVAPRARRPLETLAFRGTWGQGWVPPSALGWEARYQETPAEELPWFHDGLDPDIGQALDALGLATGRALDLGCGPGTQAVALAARGFSVTACDISPTAVNETRRRALQAGVTVEACVDDILHSRLAGPFELIVDRGVFHCFADEGERRTYLAQVRRLLAPGGWLLLKCFHRDETREQGPPGRYDASDIRRLFGAAFEIAEIRESRFHGSEDPPKALFCVLRRRAEPISTEEE